MSRRRNAKGRQPCGSFYWIPRKVHKSADFRCLNPYALKLLVSLAFQFNGKNNGDLTAAWTVMHEKHGFRSRKTLTNSKKALLGANLICLTRQGGLGRCCLYALTWMPIDDCGGKLDLAPTILDIRKEWSEVNLTMAKTKRMSMRTKVEFARRKEQMKR